MRPGVLTVGTKFPHIPPRNDHCANIRPILYSRSRLDFALSDLFHVCICDELDAV